MSPSAARRTADPEPAAGTWVYGVIRSRRSPPRKGAPDGPPGLGPLRLLDAGEGLWLAVADAPLSAYDAATIEARLQDLDWLSERAVAHDAVVAHLSSRATVVPMKLFTIFHGDARALADVQRRRRRLEGILDRLAGREEWGLRIRHDPKAMPAAPAPSGPPDSGRSFLLRKQAARDAAAAAAGRAAETADALVTALTGRAAEVRHRPPPAGAASRLLVDAAFLVPRRRLDAFKADVARAEARLGSLGCEVSLTGPWPPYHFVEPEK